MTHARKYLALFLGALSFYVAHNVLQYINPFRQSCVSKITIIGLFYSLSPGCRHAIIWTNIVIYVLENRLQWIFIKSIIFPSMKMHLTMSSAEWCLFRIGHNVLKLIFIPAYAYISHYPGHHLLRQLLLTSKAAIAYDEWCFFFALWPLNKTSMLIWIVLHHLSLAEKHFDISTS